MKIFDGHSDIFTDVTMKRLNGEKNVIKNHHIERLRKGGIDGTILVIWIDPPYTDDPSWRMLQILGAISDEIEDMKDIAGIVYNYNDILNLREKGKLPIIIGCEGLSGIKDDLSLLTMLHRFGARHASLTWNEENELATGVRSSNKDRGLTPLGIQAIHKLEELNMIIDVSHANEKTFWDIYENTTKPFIASHSNAYSLCNAPRNLKDDQIKAIAGRNGVIGMNSWPDFINLKNPTVEHLANHIDYIAELVGIDSIGLGFDFCDFLQGDTTASFQDSESTAAIGLEDAAKIPALIDILVKRGYKTEDIEKIAYKNYERVIKEIIG
ncbi:MAG: dipeptidase [Sedimentibacter sp.]|uniref:dipeptidase n=1 Tax=Sedimentibacter sp. TaxID=1960295 RepID=UPI0029827A2D|nr:dipeptidase [Sedimentibacter sp.]MDW5299046.1 dipeptidase [Sedimentibacter sp.]